MSSLTLEQKYWIQKNGHFSAWSKIKHRFWWFVHNCIVHPLCGMFPYGPLFRLHERSTEKLYLKHVTYKPS